MMCGRACGRRDYTPGCAKACGYTLRDLKRLSSSFFQSFSFTCRPSGVTLSAHPEG